MASKQSRRTGRGTLSILYLDEFLCVVEKPAGLLSCTFPGNSAKTAADVLGQMLARQGRLGGRRRVLTVHRLDRETSGVMMFALTDAARTKIMDGWHTMVTERLYRAVAENPRPPAPPLPGSGLIDSPLAYNAYHRAFVPRPEDAARFKTEAARTEFRTIARGATHTLLELSLDTGRKNQIRAHLASLGCPLAGDSAYRARTDPFGRLCLHARTLSFTHPFTGEPLSFRADEDPAWQDFVLTARPDTAHEPQGTRGAHGDQPHPPRRARKTRR